MLFTFIPDSKMVGKKQNAVKTAVLTWKNTCLPVEYYKQVFLGRSRVVPSLLHSFVALKLTCLKHVAAILFTINIYLQKSIMLMKLNIQNIEFVQFSLEYMSKRIKYY